MTEKSHGLFAAGGSMKSLSFFAFLAFFALWGAAPSARAAEDSPSLEPLRAWAEKYPGEQVGNKTAWEVGRLRETVEKIIGKERVKIFKRDFETGVSFPVEAQGNLLRFLLCKRHECISSSIDIFVNLADQTVSVCWMRYAERTAYWLEADKQPLDIGPAGCIDPQGFGLYEKIKAKK